VGDKFPKLLIGRPGAKPNQLEPYTGELKLGAIHEHLTTITPGVIIPELTRYTDFESTCINKAGVCIVALLPSRFDKPLDIFKKVASRRFSAANGQSPASLPNINFAWVNSDRQEEFAEGFDVDQFPAVLALNSRKKLFSAMKGTFETAQIRGFITAVLQGKESLIKIEKIPKLHKNNPSVSAAKMDELMGRRSDL